MIELENESDGTKKTFYNKVAERTLKEKQGKYKNTPYWKLPEDSEYKFKDGDLVKKQKRTDKKEE